MADFEEGDFVRGNTTAGSYHGNGVEVQGWYLHPLHGDPAISTIGLNQNGDGPCACVDTASLRLIRKRAESSAPSEEPKVGETWEAYECNGTVRSVTLTGVYWADGSGDIWTATHTASNWGYIPPGPRKEGFRQLIRRVSSAPSDETKAEDEWDCLACGAKCGAHPDQCGICGTVRGQSNMRGTKQPDPYRTPATETTSYAIWAAKQDGRHAAMVEAHRKELDRATAERLKNTRNWPEAWSTAGDES